jgi:uncharacterized membrane protein YhhN
MQSRLSMLEVLLVQAASLATATAALGLVDLHRIAKPLAMVMAIAFVAVRARGRGGIARFDALLMLALAFSLTGDAFLMFEGYFIAGLASFLAAHVCYIVLFKDGVEWLPNWRALALVLALATAMYAFLFGHLPEGLRLPVAAYTLAIALMAAQAIGRAMALRNASAAGVATGAVLFMLSDSLLAINRFAMPLPMAQFWVLATYYAAQALIVHNASAVMPDLIRHPRCSAQVDPGSRPG